VKESGTGEEGLGRTLAVLLLRAPGKPGAEGSSLLRRRPGQAPGRRWTLLHPTNLPVGARAPSPCRI